MMSKDNYIPEAIFFGVSATALAAAVICGGASKTQITAAAAAACAIISCIGAAARYSKDKVVRAEHRKLQEGEREVLNAGTRR